MTNAAHGRRDFLRLSSLAAVGSIAPMPLLAALTRSFKRPTARSLRLYNTHTAESLDVEYYRDGVYSPEALLRIDWIMRDHRAGEAASMDRRLLDLLHTLAAQLGTSESFHIISAYRTAETNSRLRNSSSGVARRSMHVEARAIDIRIPTVRLRALRDCAMALGQGGVGFSETSDFVHVDTGRVRHW